MTADADLDFMRAAIAEAEAAGRAGEVPVGAVLVEDGQVLARAGNAPIATYDASAHAEIRVLRAAGQAVGNYRLPGTTLYVTLEPCAMCAAALVHARVGRVVYATDDPKAGGCGSVVNLIQHPRLNHRVELAAGVLADEASALLRDFFRARR
jgi:tRNA(adenine34) deaminase